MKILMIANDYWPVFPTEKASGVEGTIQNFAIGFYKHIRKYNLNHTFSIIVPRRKVKRDYGFDIIETDSPPVSEQSPSNFQNDVVSFLKENAKNYDIIWATSNWSEVFANFNIPVIASIHDGFSKKPDNFLVNKMNLFYRFVSKYHYNVFVKEYWEKEKSFYTFTGMCDEEFKYSQTKQDYYLWCSSLFWGVENKGLDDFIRLAQINSHKQFVAYGVGPENVIGYIKTFEKSVPNFFWMGELKHGEAHQEVFSQAKALILTSKLPESLNRVAMEALCRSTVVLGYKVGSVPEEIQSHHGTYNNYLILNKHLDDKFDYNKSYQYAHEFFHIDKEIETFLKYSSDILTKGTLY